MTQLPLFEQSGRDASGLIPAKSRRTDPATSREAAERVTRSGASAGDRAAILAVIKRKPGLTAGEIAAELGDGWTNVRVSRRTAELEDAGLISPGAARVCSSRGTRMTTWHYRG